MFDVSTFSPWTRISFQQKGDFTFVKVPCLNSLKASGFHAKKIDNENIFFDINYKWKFIVIFVANILKQFIIILLLLGLVLERWEAHSFVNNCATLRKIHFKYLSSHSFFQHKVKCQKK